MLGADVVKDTGRPALHPEIDAIDRVGVNRVAGIFAARMLIGFMRGETLADSDKRFPLIAHPVSGLLAPREMCFPAIVTIAIHRRWDLGRKRDLAKNRVLKGDVLIGFSRFDQAPTNAAPGIDPPRCTSGGKGGDEIA